MRLLFLLALITGCGSLAHLGPEDLKKSVRSYNDAVRWKSWQKASSFVDETQRSLWLQHRVNAGNTLQIADVQISSVERPNTQETQAIVSVNVSWYRLPNTTLQITAWQQTWEHFPKRGWRMMKEEQLKTVVPDPKPLPPTEAAPANWP